MLVLYEHPLSPYAQKVKISAREKNADLDLRTPDGIGAGTSQGEFVAANPRAEVPVLIDGGTRIFDSTIILEYLEDKFPSPAMLPATPEARAKARMIEEVCDTHYEAINWGLGEIGFAPDEGSPLGRWLARTSERPSVAQTAKEALDSIAGMQTVAKMLEQGLFKREYRDHRLEWMMKTGGPEIVLDGLKKDNIRFSYEFE